MHSGFVICLFFALFVRAEDELHDKLRQRRGLTETTVLTEADKKVAVDEHNRARRIVVPTASDMLEMVWDEGLAQIAVSYSKQCLWKHNAYRHGMHSNFSSIGENLYLNSNPKAAAISIKDAVKSWDEEKHVYTYSTRGCTGVCGHYTQVVWATSYGVGCGVSSCTDVQVDTKVWPTAQIVVCNYGPTGNFPIKPYTSGASCTACPKDFPNCNNKLCSKTGGAGQLAPKLGSTLVMLAVCGIIIFY